VQVAGAAGIRINHTPSLPIGIWIVEPAREALRRGQVVSFCLADQHIVQLARDRGYLGRGSCPGGHEPLLKRVYGVPGDRVRLDAAGVTVNGIRLRGTSPLVSDGAGRRLASARFRTWVLAADEVWVGSRAAPSSFDSRYFGPVSLSNLMGIAKLVWPRS
jgi:conjugative transfer signal peptidase TraF